MHNISDTAQKKYHKSITNVSLAVRNSALKPRCLQVAHSVGIDCPSCGQWANSEKRDTFMMLL